MLYKILHQPDDKLLREDDIIEKLSEREKFRDAFCTNIIEGVSETLVVETSADSQKRDIPEAEARERAAKRMKIACNFPARMLVYSPKRKSSQITTALQVGGYYFEWNNTSLIMPKRVDTLTAKQPVLRLSLSQEGAWPSFVNELQPRIADALEKLDYDALVHLQYELATRKDDLLYALIEVCVKYNRVNAYRQKKCNNTHFMKDAQRALGIAKPSEVSRTMQKHLKKAEQAWKKLELGKVKLDGHGDVDRFVEEMVPAGNMTQDGLEYLMSKFFQFHSSGWDRTPEGKEEWSCAGLKCMLKDVEDKIELCMW